MSIKKLPHEVQNLLRASSQINTFKKAIEELVYNSLDADSTSIAIQLNVQEGAIQVIDNGCGIRQSDIRYIGQRHMTSINVDVSTLKTAPNKYGLRGEALANIIAVSQMMNIVSRLADKEDTWIKTFFNGREKKIAIAPIRSSKGTTVEVKGFLYNLNIQKKTINKIDELQNLRTFLEQLSLVHSNISLSLRDDTKNEIIFQIHKKRDIYHTLQNLFNIERHNVQELSVEKNEYKVTGFIGKNDDVGKHWIYLNRKFVSASSKLYKLVNDNLSKNMYKQNALKVKSKIIDNENNLFTNKIPFYFIFISCPYLDCDISHTPNLILPEFNDWNKMKILLEKLIKFYVGDINLKPQKKSENAFSTFKESNTKDQVKKITLKVLGNRSDIPCISKMQNGIKGKLIKRKKKKKLQSIEMSKIIGSPVRYQSLKATNRPFPVQIKDTENNENINRSLTYSNYKIIKKKLSNNSAKKKQIGTKEMNGSPITKKIIELRNKNKRTEYKLDDKCKKIKLTSRRHINKSLVNAKTHTIKKKKTGHNVISKSIITDPIIKKFELSTDSVKQRCALIAKDAEKALNKFNENRREIFRNGTIEYSSFKKDNRSISVSKKNDEIIIHDYYPKNSEYSVIDYRNSKKAINVPYKTTYDLVHTVLRSQDKDFYQTDKNDYLKIPNESIYSPTHIEARSPYCVTPHESNRYNRTILAGCLISRPLPIDTKRNIDMSHPPKDYSSTTSKLTYESHCHQVYDKDFEDYSSHNNKKHNQKARLITKNSINNFISNDKLSKTSNSRKKKPLRSNVLDRSTMLSQLRQGKHKIALSSYTIEFSRSEENVNNIVKTTVDNLKGDLENSFYLNLEDNLTHKIPSKSKAVTCTSDICEIIEDIYEARDSNDFHKKSQSIENVHDNPLTNYHINDSKVKSSFFNSTILPINVNNNNEVGKQKKTNVVFISNNQDTNNEDKNLSKNNVEYNSIDPLDVCETVLSNVGINAELNKSFTFNYLNNSLFDFEFGNTEDKSNENDLKGIVPISKQQLASNFDRIANESNERINFNHNSALINDEDTKQDDTYKIKQIFSEVNNIDLENVSPVHFDFDIRHRLRFLPKGMSQIFENCNTKTACDYNLDEDYFNKSIYDNFANDVLINSEIYEPRIQNLKEMTTKNIETFNIKLVQENASLKFNGQQLKDAKVLGQVDDKFIAAIIIGYCSRLDEISKFLVLFDQHAVHERIRLEKNLLDYVSDSQWISVPIDEFTLTLTRDEVIYLHNYKEKFEQLGMQWTILDNNEIKINSIPQAILGKHPRQIDKVTRAIKTLIAEEVSIIKMQKGCISLYPKSIMDLVFSEACRYAIKFGDNLSKVDCEELLKNLSDCKMPFQCAHGRPVMAVLMNYKNINVPDYKINPQKLIRIKKMTKKVKSHKQSITEE